MKTPTWAEAMTALLLFNAVNDMEDNDIQHEEGCEGVDSEEIASKLFARYTWIPNERTNHE